MQVEDKCCNPKHKELDYSNENSICKLRLKLEKFIETIANQEGYETYLIEETPFSTKGGNLLGVLCEIEIKSQSLNGYKETNLFVKQPVKSDHQTTFSIEDIYNRECVAYKELSKVFEELQDEAKIPLGERYIFAKCYEADTDLIVLENLMKSGFKTYNRMDVISIPFAELAIKHLAKLHGLFYVLQKKRSAYFNDNLRKFEQAFIDNDEFRIFADKLCKTAVGHLDERSREKVKKFIPIISDMYFKIMSYSSAGSTICHGDYKINNILVKEVNGVPSQVIPVDYQLMCYGTPLNDFMFFIFTSTDKQFRKQHLQNLKNLYHDSLTKFLNHFQLDVNAIFSKEEFERQFKERLDYVLLIGLFVMPILFTAEDKVPDMGKENLSDVSFVIEPRYSDRIQGIIDELIEWGYL